VDPVLPLKGIFVTDIGVVEVGKIVLKAVVPPVPPPFPVTTLSVLSLLDVDFVHPVGAAV
jgi:hypothetical protein